MLDVVCFFVDVVPWVIMVIGMFCVSHRQKNPQAVVGIFFLLLYTFVYGWGTRNAGTAMRHRDQCLGIMIMAALMETDRDGGREISRT